MSSALFVRNSAASLRQDVHNVVVINYEGTILTINRDLLLK